jgi:modification methylase
MHPNVSPDRRGLLLPMSLPPSESMPPTIHRLVNGDARDLSFLGDESVHLAVTSPPYWNLKRYNENPDQLGHVQDYETFLTELEKVWRHVFRVLVPGGRLVCVVGDVCVARRNFGRHLVFPLHSDISVICRHIGFDNLNPNCLAQDCQRVVRGFKWFKIPWQALRTQRNHKERHGIHSHAEETGGLSKADERSAGR